MERHSKLIISLVLMAGASAPVIAGNDDSGLWLDAGATKKLGTQWSLSADAEFRTRNDFKTVDRWSGGLSAAYRVNSYLKMSAGYELLYDNNEEKMSFHSNSDYKKWIPSYWSMRHRFYADVTASLDVNRFTLSLRERWQYSYRPEKTTDRYVIGDNQWEDKTVSGKGTNVCRSRFQIEYNIRKFKADPYVSVELFNGKGGLQKTRYTAGAEYKFCKNNSIDLYYRYQNVNNDDDEDEPNMHIIGIGYEIKF